MPDLTQLLGPWGYVALFVLVVLGNVGVPLPAEPLPALADYLVWRADMRLPVVLVVGGVSAVAADTLGYWVGRRFGRNVLPRSARWVLGHAERLSTMAELIERRGLRHRLRFGRVRGTVAEVSRPVERVILASALALIGWRIVHALRRQQGPVI